MGQPARHQPVRSRELHPTDPVTGFGSREQLTDDLDEALDPESLPGVLAVFDLAGSEEYRRLFGLQAGNVLIARLAEECARTVATNGRCYRPRQDEFCVLVDMPVAGAMPILEDAARALREEGAASLISVSFGIVLLPDEPTDAIDALIIADQQLNYSNRRDRRG